MTQKESQAELGGGNTPSLGFTVPSSDIDFENETWLIGRDLKKLSGNVPFVKIVFVKPKTSRVTTSRATTPINNLNS